MIDLHGRLRCPRCNAGVMLTFEIDRHVLSCFLCAWQAEGASARERRLRAEIDAGPHGPQPTGRPRKVLKADGTGVEVHVVTRDE